MTQLTLDINAIDKSSELLNSNNFGSKFIVSSVYDKVVSKVVRSYLYTEKRSTDQGVTVNFHLIPDTSFVPQHFVYFDTIYTADNFLARELELQEVNVNCYINVPKNTIVSDIHKNMKTIISNFYVLGDMLRKKPEAQLNSYDWLTYNPSVSMFCIKADFVLKLTEDYTDTAECRYRTSPIGSNKSAFYKYANKASSNVCGHPSTQANNVDSSSINVCPFIEAKQVVQCPYYTEDKIKISTLELVLKDDSSYKEWNDNKTLSKTIEVFLIREILTESYVLSFIEHDLKTQKTSVLKKLSYTFVSFDNYEEKNNLIQEASSILSTVLMDYSKDYAHKIIRHIEDASQLRPSSKTETRVSYLSALKK